MLHCHTFDTNLIQVVTRKLSTPQTLQYLYLQVTMLVHRRRIPVYRGAATWYKRRKKHKSQSLRLWPLELPRTWSGGPLWTTL
jgi:hypothetical protein